jgi:ribosome hibernation promoting factor
MNVDYVARHFQLDEATRQFAENKLQKLHKFVQEPVEFRLTLEVGKVTSSADLHVAHRFGVIQAREETETLLDAIRLAIDKAEKQVRRANNKFHDRRRRAEPHTWPVEVVDAASVGDGRTPRIVEASSVTIKPMSLEEAALLLEDSKHEFVVFRNSDNDRIGVLYRRKDRNFGLISPEE